MFLFGSNHLHYLFVILQTGALGVTWRHQKPRRTFIYSLGSLLFSFSGICTQRTCKNIYISCQERLVFVNGCDKSKYWHAFLVPHWRLLMDLLMPCGSDPSPRPENSPHHRNENGRDVKIKCKRHWVLKWRVLFFWYLLYF